MFKSQAARRLMPAGSRVNGGKGEMSAQKVLYCFPVREMGEKPSPETCNFSQIII
jgi:hypothetical protein